MIFLFVSCKNETQSIGTDPESNQLVITQDIKNFYTAFDSIKANTSEKLKGKFLKELFLKNASSGQRAMMKARNYKPKEYLEIIALYPNFFESMRETMMNAQSLGEKIDSNLQILRKYYPNMEPAQVFFTIGAFRSNGTTMGDKVLIGSEMAMVNSKTDLSEFPADYWARNYWKTNPIENIIKLNVHEFVHTQQAENLNAPLFVIALREGVAEFIADKVMGISKSENHEPSIKFGRENEEEVINEFIKDMFKKDFGYWLWSNQENKFNTRDLAYFVGYVIAEKYYLSQTDNAEAIKSLIQLDYTNVQEVEKFIDATNYFPKKLSSYSKFVQTN